MATQVDAIEADVDVVPTRITDEQIARDRAKAAQLPDKPMDAEESDIVVHPSEKTMFNNMAEKLDKAMKEVTKADRVPDKSPAAVKQETPKKDEKAKSEESEQAPEQSTDAEDKTITSAKAKDWKALKDKIKLHETTAKEFEQKYSLVAKEYDEFKKRAIEIDKFEETNKRLAEIQAERDQWKKQVEEVALEKSPEFAAQFDSKFTDALRRAKDAAGSKAEQIESLMQLPPSKWRKEQINAIREELEGVDQGQLDVALSDYDRTRHERETSLKNGSENYKKLLGIQAEKKNRERELEAHRLESVINSVVDMAKKNYDSFKASDDAEQAKLSAANEERLRKFYKGQLDSRELAMMPILASEQERLSKTVIPAMEKKIKELEATLAEYDKSNPKPSGGRTTTPNSKPAGFIESFTQNWPGK